MTSAVGAAGTAPAPQPPRAPTPPATAQAEAFAAALAAAVGQHGGGTATGLRLSGHARERLAEAGVSPEGAQWEAAGLAVGRAAAKGSRQALVVLPTCALVVAVPERTVVTALSPGRMRDHVFTGIDSAVFVN